MSQLFATRPAEGSHLECALVGRVPGFRKPAWLHQYAGRMDMFGWIAVVAGAGLFISSLIRTIRANPDARIPFNRNPPIVPPGSIAMRSIGAGLLVFGVVGLANSFGTWSLLLTVGVALVALAAMTIHNHRLTSTTTR